MLLFECVLSALLKTLARPRTRWALRRSLPSHRRREHGPRRQQAAGRARRLEARPHRRAGEAAGARGAARRAADRGAADRRAAAAERRGTGGRGAGARAAAQSQGRRAGQGDQAAAARRGAAPQRRPPGEACHVCADEGGRPLTGRRRLRRRVGCGGRRDGGADGARGR